MCNDCWNKIDLIASKFLVEVDFGYFSVEFFGQNDWSINFRYLRLYMIDKFIWRKQSANILAAVFFLYWVENNFL